MPARKDGRNDALYAQLQRRMVQSGEWDRMSVQLAGLLNESGWLDDFKHRSKEMARNRDSVSFASLMAELRPQAEGAVSLAVKQEMLKAIRQYLEKQIEH